MDTNASKAIVLGGVPRTLTNIQSKSQIIARLNDTLRSGQSADGKIMITQGIQALGSDAVLAIRKAVASFDG